MLLVASSSMRLTGIQGARTRSGLLLVDRDEPDRIRIGDKGGGSMGAMCGRVPPSTYPPSIFLPVWPAMPWTVHIRAIQQRSTVFDFTLPN